MTAATYEEARDACRAAWQRTQMQMSLPLNETPVELGGSGAGVSLSGHDHDGSPQPVAPAGASGGREPLTSHPRRLDETQGGRLRLVEHVASTHGVLDPPNERTRP